MSESHKVKKVETQKPVPVVPEPHSITPTPIPVEKEDKAKECKKKCCDCMNSLKENCCYATNCVLQKIICCGSTVWQSLQNPVVAVNFLLGSVSITSLLVGYIKYEKRFLADKSNAVVIGSVAGLTGLLAIDTILSRKYYKRFDKKD